MTKSANGEIWFAGKLQMKMKKVLVTNAILSSLVTPAISKEAKGISRNTSR
jgi:hypothetical protein